MKITSKLLTGQLAELTEINVHEVSLVPAGANGRPLLARKSVEKAEPNWVATGDRDLEVDTERAWSGAQAAKRVFEWAGWPDAPDPTMARRAFCLYDSANAELKGSYKLGFADIVDGELVAIGAGLSQARARINQVEGVPDTAIEGAQALLDSYAEQDDNTEMDKSGIDSKLAKAIKALQKLRKSAATKPTEVDAALEQVAKFLSPETQLVAGPGSDTELVSLLKQSTELVKQLRAENEQLRSKTTVPASITTVTGSSHEPSLPSEYRQGKAR